MIKLVNILFETFNDNASPPKKEKFFNGSEVVETSLRSGNIPEEVVSSIFELISKAYAHVGGHGSVRSEDELYKYDLCLMADTDDDDKPNVVLLGERVRNGSTKLSVFGTDSSSGAKSKMMEMVKDVLTREEVWAEIPRQFAGFLYSRGVPMLEDENKVMMLLGRRIDPSSFKWLGDMGSEGKGAGYYQRNFFGKEDIRAIMGNVPDSLFQKIIDFTKKQFSL